MSSPPFRRPRSLFEDTRCGKPSEAQPTLERGELHDVTMDRFLQIGQKSDMHISYLSTYAPLR